MQMYLLLIFLQGFGDLTTGTLLNSLRETRVNYRASAVIAITTVPLSIFLIPRLGVVGLLIATLVVP